MRKRTAFDESGFTLLELMIAMGITLTVMVIASTLVLQSFNVRSRENRRSEALADTQRAIQVMTRDIANAGMGLDYNGLVATDSTATSIRVRSDLDVATEIASSSPIQTSGQDEDVKYMLINDANGKFIVRQNLQPTPVGNNWSSVTTILANRVDNLTIRYFRQKVSYDADPTNCNITNVSPTNVTINGSSVANEVAASPASAGYVVISVCVQLPAVGTQGQGGYQPASVVQLVSDATLRNSNLNLY